MPILRALFNQVAGFVFPPACLLCDNMADTVNPWLCQGCTQKLNDNAAKREPCPKCALNTQVRKCSCELVWDHPYSRIVALADYDESVASAMASIKYHGRPSFARAVAAQLSFAIPADFFSQTSAFIPVPLHFMRKLKRGYNQAEMIARGVASACPAAPPIRTDIVRRVRSTKTQTKLDKSHRRANLANAFALTAHGRQWIAGRIVVLVDDVVTTGATTGVCAGVLLAGGAAEVRVLSLARD